jgi:hypothetical protein
MANFDDLLKLVRQAESGGREFDAAGNVLTSPAGAKGSMQVMDTTNRDPGYGVRPAADNSLDERARVGQDYLRAMLTNYGGDVRKALAAYNAGPGSVDRAISRGGDDWMSYLPKPAETVPYVNKIVGGLTQQPNMLDRAAAAVLPSAQAATPAQGISSKIQAARGAGYSDAEIMQHLGASQGFADQMRQAKDAGYSDAEIFQHLGLSAPSAAAQTAKSEVSDSALVGLGAGLGKGVGTVALNAQRYLGKGLNAVSDVFSPPERNLSSLITGQQPQGGNSVGNWLVQDAEQGLKKLEGEVAPYREASPIATGAGEIGGNIAATLPVGGILAKGAQAVAPGLGLGAAGTSKLAQALQSSGMRLGGAPATTTAGKMGDLLLRGGAGAATGGISAGLVNPNDVGMGAAIGAAFPVAGMALGKGSEMLGRALRGGEVSQPVRDLAEKAASLGISVPADRIANSRPMNALAASLNYVPFSGRAAVEDAMQSQLNRALSRTFGQDSTNVTQALRNAAGDLGSKFDDVLKNNVVKVDETFLSSLAERAQQAVQELPEAQARVINNQIDEIITQASKGGGQLDGQLAYNFKRTLDRIGGRTTPEAYYANELKKDLMGALNRSLAPEDAAAFARTRQQYGNMLSLENLAKNGVEGDISIARLANMRNIRNPELQELADISAQFLRPREGQHGAAQRIMAGALMGYGAGIPAAAASVGIGRLANSLLNSTAARNVMLGQQSNTALANALRQVLPVTAAKSVPVLSAQ